MDIADFPLRWSQLNVTFILETFLENRFKNNIYFAKTHMQKHVKYQDKTIRTCGLKLISLLTFIRNY